MSVEDYRIQEKDWASRLHGLSLVSEASIEFSVSITAFQFVCRSYRAQSNCRDDRIRVLQRYPASLLAGLTGIASSRYDEGTFWPKVEEEAGIVITQIHQAEFSDAFRHGLDHFRLSRFDTPQRNIGEILMHAGIPVLSMDSFVRLLVERDSKRSDLTGEDFCSWVGGMTREFASAKGLDAPTWRFLKEGGAISSDLTERLLVFLDAAAKNRQELCDEALRAIPRHLAEKVNLLFRSGQLHLSTHRQRSRRHEYSPSIVYQDGLIQLGLPPMESPVSGEHTWRFTTTGESWSRTLASSWSYDRSLATREPISRPVTDIVVAYPLLDRDWKLSLVDPEMPLLAFDYSSGKYLPSTHQLPQSWVWLAFPYEGSSACDALEVDGTLEIREYANTPTGWPGWRFVAVDLSDVKRLRPVGVTNRWRLISTIKRPTLRNLSEVPFVRSQAGSTVFSARPKLSLPASPEHAAKSAQVEWHIQTLDASDETIASFPVYVGTDVTEIDPWTGNDDVLLGEYEIRVVGALGQSAKFDVTLAEGLAVDATPSFRRIDRHGVIEAAVVRLQFGDRTQEIRVEAGVATDEVVLDNGDARMPIVVAPPHMWISAERPGSPSRPSITPLLLEIERLPEMTLKLDIGPEQRGTLKLLSEYTTLLEEPLDSGSSGAVKIPLARFHDSSQSVGGGELYVQWDNRVSFIGRVRPKKLASGVTLTSDVISLDRVYENLDLQVMLQVDNAPWLRIEPLRFSPGTTEASIHPSALGRGSLTASVRPFDPWDFELTSEQGITNRENQFCLESDFDGSLDSLEDHFIHWVAGISPIPFGTDAIAFALDIYGTLGQGRDHNHAAVLFRDVATLSITAGSAMLEALPESRWSQKTHTRLLAEGWPATAPREQRPAVPAIWKRSPFLGVLTSLGDLSATVSHQQLSDWLGEESVCILAAGNDPAMAAGSFDAGAAVLADKPKPLQDLIWKAHTPVPGQILTKDQRLVHARELFDHRADVRLQDLIGASSTIIEEVNALLDINVGRRPSNPLQARAAPRGWRQLPQASLGLAFASRLAARAVEEAVDLHDYAQHWYAELATCAPAFVEQDLILAELWLTRWEIS